MRPLPEGPLVAWRGDDFTGSAAAMAVLSFAGLPSALFFEPPTPARLARFPGLRGVGVAGDARTRSPAWMRAELPGVFAGLRALGAPVVRYEVCPTFDGAPEAGSIGAAAEVGLAAGGWAPLEIAGGDTSSHRARARPLRADGRDRGGGGRGAAARPVRAREPRRSRTRLEGRADGPPDDFVGLRDGGATAA